jgi:glycosyltransferase involved in cell wall biosynthesis
VALLAEDLCARGHRVTLFASGDIRSPAHLSGTEATALRPQGLSIPEQRLRDLRHVGAALARAEEFDVIHNHHGPRPLGLDTGAAPMLTTLHGPMTPEHRQPFEGQHPCVAISRHQALHATGVHVLGVVHNGVDVGAIRHHHVAEDVLQPHEWGRALVFLGRISPEKEPHLAIRTGQRLGLPVVLAGKIDPVDRSDAESAVLPTSTAFENGGWVKSAAHARRRSCAGHSPCSIRSAGRNPSDWCWSKPWPPVPPSWRSPKAPSPKLSSTA